MLHLLLPTALFAFGDAIRAYPSFASRNQWPIGARFRNGYTLQFLGVAFGMAPACVWAFATTSWWIAWLVAPIGYLLGIILTVTLKEWIQVAGPIGVLVLAVAGLVKLLM
jgi:hypothetical protein